MAKSGKKHRAIVSQVPKGKVFLVKDALEKLKNLAYAKFDESIDVDIALGIDAAKGEQTVRNSVLLPHGTGKRVRIVVFAKGDFAEQAKAAGADFIGTTDLIEKIQGGWLDFEAVVATPDLMNSVGQLAKILGPKGLLPNKKDGTVTFDVAKEVADIKKGRVRFKNDKQGLIHLSIGKKSFSVQQLHENLAAFIKVLCQSKPATAKGKFVKKIYVTSTMGVGIALNPEELTAF
jgi:large subunit ribosomal protein L1